MDLRDASASKNLRESFFKKISGRLAKSVIVEAPSVVLHGEGIFFQTRYNLLPYNQYGNDLENTVDLKQDITCFLITLHGVYLENTVDLELKPFGYKYWSSCTTSTETI